MLRMILSRRFHDVMKNSFLWEILLKASELIRSRSNERIRNEYATFGVRMTKEDEDVEALKC